MSRPAESERWYHPAILRRRLKHASSAADHPHGTVLVYRPQPDAGHNTTWWPDVRPSFEQFVREHPRNPLPDALTWQISENDPFPRAHWLVIDRLGPQDGPPKLPDVNVIATPSSLQFGVRSAGAHVTYIMPGSNAAAVGLRAGDTVAKVNDETLEQGGDVELALDRCCTPGARIHLRVSRGGVPVELNGTYEPKNTFGSTVTLFPRRHPNGRVDLVKTGNAVRATTNGVAEFTLLLSPDAFDFARPVTVITNGKVVFEGRVTKSVATLLKWAAIDSDRTMLFGAELHVKVN